jgi:aminoglycoside/choline kinase family phosphotransferase
VDKRQDEETRDRIQSYLDRSGLIAENPRVVPLTPDASDRRYFRILLPGQASIVLSLYAAPFDVSKLSFVNVATLMARMPVPIPEVLGHAGDLGVLSLQDLGDVTLQAHLGAATPEEHAALYRQAVALIATLQKRGQQLASPEYLPYGISFDVE